MKILFHNPITTSLSAGRTITNGYKNAFNDLGHTFNFLTPACNQEKELLEYKPDIFFTSLNSLHLRFLNLDLLKKAKKSGTKVFVNTPFWESPFSKLRITESPSLSQNKDYISLITSENYGDVYYNICEQNDLRMRGFEKSTGKKHTTILLAADKTLLFPDYDSRFSGDISYIGTNLPQKKDFFNKVIFPLKNSYKLSIYGQDWTFYDKSLGYIQKFGQYFDIPYLSSIRKPKLDLSDERKIYSSSVISINVHEEYQKKFGDLNERTFKIPLAGGFEIVDNVKTISKYFKIGKEIVVAENDTDWADKIKFYSDNPEKRTTIIEAGRKKVLQEHTYHHRVKQIISLYKSL